MLGAITAAASLFGGGGGGGGGGGLDVGGIINTIKGGSADQAKIAEAQREADNKQTEESIKTTVVTQTNKMARESIKQTMESAAEDVTAHGRKASQGYRA